VLDSAIQHPPPAAPPTREEAAQKARANFVEMFKDRWNAEVEGAVRWVQGTDWRVVRERAEDRVAGLFGASLNGGEIKDMAVAAGKEARSVVEGMATSVKDTAATASEVVKEESKAAKGKVVEAVERSKKVGKDVIGEAMGKAVEVEKKAAIKLEGESDVEKALRQRYEKPQETKKSAKEILEARYTPIDKRDNTALRGI